MDEEQRDIELSKIRCEASTVSDDLENHVILLVCPLCVKKNKKKG